MPVFQQPLWDWDAPRALHKQAHSIQHALSLPSTQPSTVLFAQCKWFCSFLALSTPLPANLPASLKLNFPLLLAAICMQPEPMAQNRHAGALLLVGLCVPPARLWQHDLVCPGSPHQCWPGLILPRSSDGPRAQCQDPPVPWGSASQSPEPLSAMVPPSLSCRDRHHPGAWGSAQLLVARLLSPATAPARSAHIHCLLIALKSLKINFWEQI